MLEWATIWMIQLLIGPKWKPFSILGQTNTHPILTELDGLAGPTGWIIWWSRISYESTCGPNATCVVPTLGFSHLKVNQVELSRAKKKSYPQFLSQEDKNI